MLSRSITATASSPRRWGCFFLNVYFFIFIHVFPTQVGVFPAADADHHHGWCLPHAGGGVSPHRVGRLDLRVSSPRRWGCFSILDICILICPVFPTQVGVFPKKSERSQKSDSLPHAGGGVSVNNAMKLSTVWSSPRRWGCFH